jgi:HEAT repeat protein
MSEPTELERIEAALASPDVAALADGLSRLLAASGRAASVHAALRQAKRRFAQTPAALFALGCALAERDEQLAKGLAAALLGELYAGHEEIVRAVLLRLADDDDWVVREYAASGLGSVLDAHFDAAYPWFVAWTRHPSENIRRAAALATMPAGRSGDAGRAARCLDLLEPLLTDRSVYVRKNLGPFALGAALLVRHPDATFAALARWRDRYDDEQARWNLAMACAASGGTRWPERALAFLHTLADDPRPYVWRAVASALLNLGRKQPDVALPEIRRWLADPARRHVAERALETI